MKKETKTKLKDYLKKTRNIKDLLYNLKCTICHDILVEATVTNYGHSYCKSCIETWKKEESKTLDHGKEKLAKCPNCNTEIQTLSTNHMLKTHIEEMCDILLSEAEKSARQETIQENINAEKLAALKRAASARAVLGRSSHRHSHGDGFNRDVPRPHPSSNLNVPRPRPGSTREAPRPPPYSR